MNCAENNVSDLTRKIIYSTSYISAAIEPIPVTFWCENVFLDVLSKIGKHKYYQAKCDFMTFLDVVKMTTKRRSLKGLCHELHMRIGAYF